MSDWCVKSINIIHTDGETSCLIHIYFVECLCQVKLGPFLIVVFKTFSSGFLNNAVLLSSAVTLVDTTTKTTCFS